MAECCLVQGQELAQALSSEHGVPLPLVSLNLAYCSSLKVSTPSLSFLSRAGAGELPSAYVQGIAVRTELGTIWKGKKPRQ